MTSSFPQHGKIIFWNRVILMEKVQFVEPWYDWSPQFTSENNKAIENENCEK